MKNDKYFIQIDLEDLNKVINDCIISKEIDDIINNTVFAGDAKCKTAMIHGMCVAAMLATSKCRKTYVRTYDEETKQETNDIETKIKKTLKEANRYDDICIILSNITKLNCQDYPVHAYDEDGKIKRSVKGKDVLNEAEKLLKFIDGETTIIDKCLFDHFSNLYMYVNSFTDSLLHNYSVDISHGIEPKIDMEDIRPWLILDNLIVTLDIDGDWSIPDGWKRR